MVSAFERAAPASDDTPVLDAPPPFAPVFVQLTRKNRETAGYREHAPALTRFASSASRWLPSRRKYWLDMPLPWPILALFIKRFSAEFLTETLRVVAHPGLETNLWTTFNPTIQVITIRYSNVQEVRLRRGRDVTIAYWSEPNDREDSLRALEFSLKEARALCADLVSVVNSVTTGERLDVHVTA